MKPKYLKQNPSILPDINEVIRLLSLPPNFGIKYDDIKTDIIIQNNKKKYKKQKYKSKNIETSKNIKTSKNNNINVNIGGPNDDTKYENKSSDLTDNYVDDLGGIYNDTTNMILNEIKKLGLKSAKIKRATKDYYQRTIQWRQELLKAPNINYLCKALLMKNSKCTNNNCNDPTNSLYYLVIFVKYPTRNIYIKT